MVKQSNNYIQTCKKLYIKRSLIWLIVLLIIYFSGWIILSSNKSYFTVMAGLMAIPIAQNVARLLGFMQFKDGKEEYAKILETLQGSIIIYHSAILPQQLNTPYFEHIVITPVKIYFISYNEKTVQKFHLEIENKLKAKGVDGQAISFEVVQNLEEMKRLTEQMKKEAALDGQAIEDYTKIINDLLM